MATKLLAKAKSPARRKHNIWTNKENAALVQFVALHKDLQETDKEWPSMRATHSYWADAASFIKNMSGTAFVRKGILKAFLNIIL